MGSWGERSFFFQGAGSKDPPGRASVIAAATLHMSVCVDDLHRVSSLVGINLLDKPFCVCQIEIQGYSNR